MAITLNETFRVQAPVEAVWRFVLDAQQVAACMPGAGLEEVVDGRTFLGSIAVKVGAVTARYKGRVELIEVDEQAHAVRMVAEGREPGGGTAKGTMSSSLRAVDHGATEVALEASIEITGRIAQMGRGMIQGVSQQLLQQFVTCAKARLESPGDAATDEAAAKQEPIRIVPIVLRVLWSALVRFFRRLLRRPAA